MIGDFLETYSYEYLLNFALSLVPDNLDKREGSIIYDALAPVCYLLAQQNIRLQAIYQNTFIAYAQGEALDLRSQEQGLTRYPATYAVKKVYVIGSDGKPTTVPLGARFSTITAGNSLVYSISAVYTVEGVPQAGYYEATCETAGVVGNDYVGDLTMVTNLNNVAQATMSDLITPARDEETDDELRTRYLEKVNEKSFGGNIAQYREELKGISGVGAVQIYPVWNGGGTVKLSVIDTDYNTLTEDFLTQLKETIDPENNSGEGIGLAPIGHKVTIVTPSEVTVNINTTLTLMQGYVLSQVEDGIKSALGDYINSLRQHWGDSNETNTYSTAVYIARVNASILSVEGVANVTGTTINDTEADLILTQDALTQELPKLGEVTLNV